jgi:hypothetical protein
LVLQHWSLQQHDIEADTRGLGIDVISAAALISYEKGFDAEHETKLERIHGE